MSNIIVPKTKFERSIRNTTRTPRLGVPITVENNDISTLPVLHMNVAFLEDTNDPLSITGYDYQSGQSGINYDSPIRLAVIRIRGYWDIDPDPAWGWIFEYPLYAKQFP